MARAQRRWPANALARFARLLTAIAILAFCAPARALYVGTTDGVIPNTSANPANTAGWSGGDPGWANAVYLGYPQGGGNYNYAANGIYIGDGWVLTANHNGNFTRVKFGSGATLDVVPNQSYQVANPSPSPIVDPRLNQPYADLKLVRVNGDPALTDTTIKSITPPTPQQQLTIASQSLSLNAQVMTMGWGFIRADNKSSFNVNTNANPWTWAAYPATPPGGCGSGCTIYSGYWSNDDGHKRWGTNRIANSDSVFGENDGNLQTIIDNSTISYVTTYDQNSGDTFESIGVNRDSGSSVFYKTIAGQWQLVGIITDKYSWPGQNNYDPGNLLAIFGNANTFADLASYNISGTDAQGNPKSEIKKILNAHLDYSAVGDLNLDGVAGAPDDIAAFVAGWGCGTAARPDCTGGGNGNMFSWKNGDMTHDGITDVNDFLRMRSVLSGSAADLLDAMFFGLTSGEIPEPASILLVIGPALYFALGCRKHRPRSRF